LIVSARRKPVAAPAAAWPGRWSIAIAVGALIVAAIVWWHSAREPLEAAGTRVAHGPTAQAAAPPRAVLPPPPVAPYLGGAGITRDDPLTAYRKANVYPPASRPLAKDQLDLLQPNRRQEAMHRTDHDEHVSYLFTADRYFVIGDAMLNATLEAQRDGVPIPVTVTQSYAVVLDPVTHQEPPIQLSYAPGAGQAMAATFAPAKLGLKRQAAIAMYIEFDYGTGKQVGHFDFQYTPATGVPAKFSGTFRDAIDAGSLVIHAGVEVTTPGHYVIDANLFDAADQPVAWTRFKGDFTAGSHDADLMFFGKVITDAGAHGPFHLGQLRGARYVPELDPDLEQMPPYTGTYTTQAYATEQFSDAEYDSPEKQHMIQLLGSDASHRGGAGGHAPPQPDGSGAGSDK
jgi:hypothetical protein